MADGERPVRMDRRMTDAEALMWTVEKAPSMRSTFLQITLLDRPPDFERFRERMARAVEVLPRLRQRIVSPPARLAPPEWADDPSFDLDFHVRRFAVAPPGSERDLLDLAAHHYEDAFDRARPLWQLSIVEGLEGGGAALLTKMHHTITDGIGGVRLSMQFLDLTRDAADPPPLEATHSRRPAHHRGVLAMTGDAIGHDARRGLGVVRRTAAGAARTLVHPARLPGTLRGTVETAASLMRQGLVIEQARSPLWTRPRSLRRRFETLTVSLDQVKRAAKALDGTVNDLFVTAVAGGAGAYHRAKGIDVDELRMGMPVNRREDRSVGGNAFSLGRVVVPVGDDPVARFHTVRDRLAAVKRERALGLTEGVAGLLNNALPTDVLVRLARQQAETVDFAASNVRGAPFDLYLAGAALVANYPMGPTAGTAFNATVLSYKDRFDVGLAIDAAVVDDPALLRECVSAAFRELVELGGGRGRPTRPDPD